MASKEIMFSVPLTMDDIAEALFCLDHDDLFNFICALDLQAAEYEFTLRLRDHFVKEIEACGGDVNG